MGDRFNTRINMENKYVSRDKTIVLEILDYKLIGLKQPNDRLKGKVSFKIDNNPVVTESFVAIWREQNRVYRLRSKSIEANMGPRKLIEVNINDIKAILYNKPKYNKTSRK